MLRNYCQQGRKTATLTDVLMAALKSRRPRDERPTPRQSALPRAVVEQIVLDYRAGASTHALAERHSVRRATVRDVLRREGIDPAERAHRSKFTPELKLELCERFAAGATRHELAILYDVSESTIKRMLRMTA